MRILTIFPGLDVSLDKLIPSSVIDAYIDVKQYSVSVQANVYDFTERHKIVECYYMIYTAEDGCISDMYYEYLIDTTKVDDITAQVLAKHCIRTHKFN